MSNLVEFVVNEEAIEFLKGIKGPINVVTIAGKCRSGKSSLMNIFVGVDGIFEVGHTTDSKTKGFWLSKVLKVINSAG